MNAEEIERLVKLHLPNAAVKAKDLTGTGDHWQLNVVAEEFRGKTLVQQHQMIYRALGDLMKKEIHALALNTQEP